ncbi:MAG: hypothetical protein ACPGVX_03480, partial [Thalassobaculaceae bacterium]
MQGLAVEDQRGLRRAFKLLPVFFDPRRQKVEGFILRLNYAGFSALSLLLKGTDGDRHLGRVMAVDAVVVKRP